MKGVRKDVLPVTGLGTPFLPVTKAMPKELLPIINKPLIQYAVEEAMSAGADTLIFITGLNKRAIEDHFDDNSELKKIRPDSGGEIQLSDALNEQAIKGKLEGVKISGNRFDCGTSDGYLEAILHSARSIGKL